MANQGVDNWRLLFVAALAVLVGMIGAMFNLGMLLAGLGVAAYMLAVTVSRRAEPNDKRLIVRFTRWLDGG